MPKLIDHLDSVTNFLSADSKNVSKNPIFKNIVLISPHPDDESIHASLPLRLLNENMCNITNICMTLGSNIERRQPREAELNNAINKLQFNNVIFEKINELEIFNTLKELEPDLIICPHIKDNHYIHIESSKIIQKILQNTKYNGVLIENEYWSEIEKPNLLVEFDKNTVLTAMEAMSEHKGEIERNPFHLTLPHWLINSGRRGQELVLNRDEKISVGLAELFLISNFSNGKKKIIKENKFISKSDSLISLFN